jgi:hypothetical protein
MQFNTLGASKDRNFINEPSYYSNMGDLLPNCMNPFLLVTACVLGTMAVACSFNFVVYAQTPATQSKVNLTDILIESYPFISVEYEDSSNVVIKADEESLLLINGTLTPFWEALDKAREHGFKLDEIATSGMGSQGNPTRFYAIMSK